MGRTLPTTSVLMRQERAALKNFRGALTRDNQRHFDLLWTHVAKHLMPCTVADHVLPLQIFLFSMLVEEQKELGDLRRQVADLQDRVGLFESDDGRSLRNRVFPNSVD